MDLDPRYLEAFFVVAREHSFSRAAAVLHKTQPAVSYQIRMLEQQVATRLFDRTTRALTLTGPGERLYALCERFFGDFGRLLAALRDPTGDEDDPVRIASVSSFGRYVLFPVLARAAIRYTLRFPTAADVFRQLADGSCDLGFVYLPVTSSRIVATPVWREELVLIAPPKTRALPSRLEAYEDLPFVTYDESEYVFGHWFEAVYRRSPRTLHSAYAFEELEEVVATVARGRGWSIVPDHCVRGAAKILRHVRRRVHNTIYAVTRAGGPEHPARTQLLEALAATRRSASWCRRGGPARRARAPAWSPSAARRA